MPIENGRIADEVQQADGQIVGNEQWADVEGNSGPDPAEWANPDARQDTGFVPGETMVAEVDGKPVTVGSPIKGPDPAQHPDREV